MRSVRLLGTLPRTIVPSLGQKRETEYVGALYHDGYWQLSGFDLTSEATSHRLITTSARSGEDASNAPEILVGEKGRFNNTADIWVLGCIVFEIFSKVRNAIFHDFEAYQYGKDRKNTPNLGLPAGLDR